MARGLIFLIATAAHGSWLAPQLAPRPPTSSSAAAAARCASPQLQDFDDDDDLAEAQVEPGIVIERVSTHGTTFSATDS